MGFWKRFVLLVCNNEGQAVVEAAFLLPVVMLLLLLLLQPGIILYDRIVMQGAAAEGCRLLATSSEGSKEDCEAYIKRRLSAVPQHDLFHIHEGTCAWVIEMAGNESSSVVEVKISNQVKPLPLIDIGSSLLGLTNDEGCLEIEVQSSLATQPQWVARSEAGMNPSGWIGAWV